MPHRIESPFSFRLAEKKTAIHGQKKRRLGMSCPAKRSTHPKRGLAVTNCRLNLKLPYRLRYT